MQISALKKVNTSTQMMVLVSSGSHVCPKLLSGLFLIQEFHRLQDENFQLKTICEDQEQALEELGSKLSEYAWSSSKSSKQDHDWLILSNHSLKTFDGSIVMSAV